MDIQHFVVTTYEQWVWGVLSDHFSTAWVSQPMSYDHHNPNVVQSMVYWIQSSFEHEGGFEVPVSNCEEERPVFEEYPLSLAHQFRDNPRAVLALCDTS